MTWLDAVCQDTLLAELGSESRGEEDLTRLALAVTEERVVGLPILIGPSATAATCHEWMWIPLLYSRGSSNRGTESRRASSPHS
jgi:hypothetical protein